MRAVILYDNSRLSRKWKKGWGLSVFIENDDNERLLFDAGDNSVKLLKNMDMSEIDAGSVDALTFSHADWDHKGGAEGFLNVNRKAFVYIPHFFPGEFREMTEEAGHRWILNGFTKNELIKNVFSTPSYQAGESPEELGLVIRAGSTLVLVTGCAHPGLLNMVRKAKEIFGADVGMVIGGFHLKDSPVLEVEKLIDDMRKEGVRKFAPCHCTGRKQIAVFEKVCGPDFIEAAGGKEIRLEE